MEACRGWTSANASVYLLGCLVLLLNYMTVTTDASLQCMCTTQDCQRDNEISCQAQSMCYVQYFPEILSPTEQEASEDRASWQTGISSVVRGCIDDRTPLLCENRRPHSYTGTWPVLLCCNGEDWCNRGVMPTTPPWLEEWQRQQQASRAKLAVPDSSQGGNSEEPQPQPIDSNSYSNNDLTEQNLNRLKTYSGQKFQQNLQSHYSNTQTHATKTVNPLYIGVPVAGACVLLAIIIFAIYILKRHNQYLEDYNKRTASLKQQNLIYDPPVKVPPGRVVTVGCKKNCLYPECDRSSNGSETRLLMRV